MASPDKSIIEDMERHAAVLSLEESKAGLRTPHVLDDAAAKAELGDNKSGQPGGSKSIGWRAAKSLLVLKAQLNRAAPSRRTTDDGLIGGPARQTGESDHNPWVEDGSVGVVTAIDITHDPRNGCDADRLAEAIRSAQDSRVKYVIWNRQIANSKPIDGAAAWGWRPYAGRNPHTGHVHISVKPDKASYDAVDLWAIPAVPAAAMKTSWISRLFSGQKAGKGGSAASATLPSSASRTNRPALDHGELLRAGEPQPDELESLLSSEPDAAGSVRGRDAAFAPTRFVEFTIEECRIESSRSATAYCAIEETTKKKMVIGYDASYHGHNGISQTHVLNHLPELKYNRFAEEKSRGLWAHFIWPTVVAESGEHHLRVNTYDRAQFTFGFYQLAAHTPRDNLILLFRELLKLPQARFYFPNLTLRGGKVTQLTTSGFRLLEREEKVPVSGRVEDQIPDFMRYLNPTQQRVEPAELLNAAKLMFWLWNDPAALEASVRIAFQILQNKIKDHAKTYELIGREPELAIWVADIHHQGRGTVEAVRAALAEPTHEERLAALFMVDRYSGNDGEGANLSRRRTVRACLEKLGREQRFMGIELGRGPLAAAAE